MSDTTRKIASNTIYQIIGKAVSLSITVLTTIIVTRAYGRMGYGAFSLMQTWPALFFIIVDFGINAIAVRELSKDFSKASKYFGNILLMRIFFSLFLILILGIALLFFPYSTSLKFGITLGLLLILMQGLFTTTNIIFQVKLRYDLSTIGYLIGYGVILTLVLILSFLRINITWVNFSYVVGGLITFVVNLHLVQKLGVHPDFKIRWDIWRFLFINSLPLGLMFIFSQINFKSDSIILSVSKLPIKYGLNNTETVAVYALSYKIFEVALVVPTFFMNSVYPVLVQHMMEGKEKLKKTFMRSLAFLAVSSAFCGIIGIILSPFAIYVLGGREFTQSVLILQILIGGLILYYLTQPIAWLIVTLGKQKYLPYIYLTSAIFNVAGNILFIPKYSFYASAVVTHLSELLILVLLTIFALKSWKEKYA